MSTSPAAKPAAGRYISAEGRVISRLLSRAGLVRQDCTRSGFAVYRNRVVFPMSPNSGAREVFDLAREVLGAAGYLTVIPDTHNWHPAFEVYRRCKNDSDVELLLQQPSLSKVVLADGTVIAAHRDSQVRAAIKARDQKERERLAADEAEKQRAEKVAERLRSLGLASAHVAWNPHAMAGEPREVEVSAEDLERLLSLLDNITEGES